MMRRIVLLAAAAAVSSVGLVDTAVAVGGGAGQVAHSLLPARAPTSATEIARELRGNLLSPSEVAAAVGDRVALRVDENRCGNGDGYFSCSRTFLQNPHAKGTYSVQVRIVPTVLAGENSIDGDPGPGSVVVHRGPHRLVFIYKEGKERTAYGTQYHGLFGVTATCKTTGASQAATVKCVEDLLKAQDRKGAALAAALAAGPTQATSTVREIHETLPYVADIQQIVGSAATFTPGQPYCGVSPNFPGQRSCQISWDGKAENGSRFDVSTGVYVDPNIKIAQIQFVGSTPESSSRETVVVRTPARWISYSVIRGRTVAGGHQIRDAVTVGASCSAEGPPQVAVQCVSDVLTLQAARAASLS